MNELLVVKRYKDFKINLVDDNLTRKNVILQFSWLEKFP